MVKTVIRVIIYSGKTNLLTIEYDVLRITDLNIKIEQGVTRLRLVWVHTISYKVV